MMCLLILNTTVYPFSFCIFIFLVFAQNLVCMKQHLAETIFQPGLIASLVPTRGMADFVTITALPQPQRHLVMSGVSFMYRIPLFFQEKTHMGESRVSAKIFNTYLETHRSLSSAVFQSAGIVGNGTLPGKGQTDAQVFYF